jgi:predicted permease
VKAERLSGGEAGAHAFCAVFSNVAFMGFPLIEAFFGKESLFQASVFNIPFQVLAFSIGPVMLSAGGEGRPKPKLGPASFATPAAIASVIGFGFFLAGIELPSPLAGAMRLLGDTTTPLSMVLIGAMLSRFGLSSLRGRPQLWLTSLYRLVAFPTAVYLLLRACGAGGLLLGLPTLVAAMPAAANAAILAEAYGGDSRAASSLVFLSTLLSLPTIAALALLLRF